MSSLINLPPVTTARSAISALRRSPVTHCVSGWASGASVSFVAVGAGLGTAFCAPASALLVATRVYASPPAAVVVGRVFLDAAGVGPAVMHLRMVTGWCPPAVTY